MTSTARLDAFTRGQIQGLRQAGKSRPEIQELVKKKDGKKTTLRSIDRTLRKTRKDPKWRGEDSRAGGRPPALTEDERRQLTDLVFRERGKAKVTVPYCSKRLPFLRRVTEQTVRNALYAAGLKWLRRRRKTAILAKHKGPRKRYCRWVLKQSDSFLKDFAYTDGTTFYLARGPGEQETKQRAALGPSVWKMASGKDGLWDENVGPSMYAKAQGRPVKIWGLFANGVLCYHVLPVDPSAPSKKATNMNTVRYRNLVNTKFAKWRRLAFGSRRVRPHLVQDHEKCLWNLCNLKALKDAGFDVVKKYPKCSPDLNAIEGWWNRLRVRLEKTAPVQTESRPEFLRRLRRIVGWMNTSCRVEGGRLCRNQKVRAKAVLKLQGAKCAF